MPRRAILNQREIPVDGTIQVRIAKQVLDGDELLGEVWHRVAFTPGCDVEATIRMVDAHMTADKYGALPPDQWDKVRATIAAEHSPEIIQAYQDKLAEDAAARDAERN